MTPITDDDLYRRYCSGNDRAFDQLYVRFKQPIYNYVRKSVPSHRVEELFQDVWLKVIASKTRYKDNGRFRQWLFTCAHHLIVDEYRRASKVDEVPFSDKAKVTNNTANESKTNLQRKIDMVLDLLPNEQRQAFYLRHELECSIAEIAEIQACNPEAAKSRLRYAYSKIKIQLEDEI
ncbi:MAG: RNA polymerase sigma-70 factor (ECF subfamily) [Candidatus Azotimanducaceae bacterium]